MEQSSLYRLAKKSIKSDCPACGHKKKLSRFVKVATGEVLPEIYGRCDRQNDCGYFFGPYQKGPDGRSYYDLDEGANRIPKDWIKGAGALKRKGKSESEARSWLEGQAATPEQVERVCQIIFPANALPARTTQRFFSIPNDIFEKSLSPSAYKHNIFAQLLEKQFGSSRALSLLSRFNVGTSARWPGATVFWYIDRAGRKRGGQIKLFAEDWHTAKYTNREGLRRAMVDWVHSALRRRLQQAGDELPEWLADYCQYADCSPCLFGLTQLHDAPADATIAIVESPKTAIVCTAYFPELVWMAVGAKSYLKPERLEAVRGRRVVLYPDADAYHDIHKDGRKIKGWLSLAEELKRAGIDVEVSDFLEKTATPEQKQDGFDLADLLLKEPPTVSRFAEQLANPGITLRPDEVEIERFPTLAADEPYPTCWDEPDPPGAVPMISAKSFHEWQQQHRHFSTLGAPSLTQ